MEQLQMARYTCNWNAGTPGKRGGNRKIPEDIRAEHFQNLVISINPEVRTDQQMSSTRNS